MLKGGLSFTWGSPESGPHVASAGVGTRRSPLVLPGAGLAGHQTSVPTGQAALATCGAGQAMAAAGRFASLLSDVLLSSFSASFAFQIASDVALSVLRLPSCPGGRGAHPGSAGGQRWRRFCPSLALGTSCQGPHSFPMF